MFTDFTADPGYNVATRPEVLCYVLSSAAYLQLDYRRSLVGGRVLDKMTNQSQFQV